MRVYIDESGINEYLQRDRGRGPYGESIKGESSGKRFSRESFIAGKVQSKIIAPFCYQGTCNTELFNTWIERILLPELKEGQVVIMDNASFHKSEKSRLLIEGVGCKLLFLPPYSPDLNPIEKFWANFKRMVKGCIEGFSKLSDAIDHVFVKVCTEEK